MTILYIDQDNNYFGRSLFQGFVTESTSQSWWKTLFLPLSDASEAKTSDLFSQVDGFVTRSTSSEIEDKISKSHKPHIALRSSTSTRAQWLLHVNDVEIGQIAHNETKRLNLSNQAFLGFEKVVWSIERNNAFKRDSRRTYEMLIAPGEHLTTSGLYKICEWLASLPKPTSLFAAADSLGHAAIQASMMKNIRIPEDIAIIGADNDPHLCETSNPPLSSIDLHPYSIGRACAWSLAREIGIIKNLDKAPSVNPPSLVIRESSHKQSPNSKLFKQAVTWINTNAIQGPTVQEVADFCQTSKRTLERAFLEVNNINPATYIRRQRLQGITYLLRRKEIPLSKLSQISNFPDLSSFSNFIKRNTGKTATQIQNSSVEDLIE